MECQLRLLPSTLILISSTLVVAFWPSVTSRCSRRIRGFRVDVDEDVHAIDLFVTMMLAIRHSLKLFGAAVLPLHRYPANLLLQLHRTSHRSKLIAFAKMDCNSFGSLPCALAVLSSAPNAIRMSIALFVPLLYAQ